jgi:Zn-dependent protease/predicted transcriptional regulator
MGQQKETTLSAGKPLFRLAGIDIYIHWTFLILLTFIGATNWMKTGSMEQVAWSIAFISVLFLCVLLHEIGHSLAARRYGIETRSITLLPIGGVASLERIPEEPKQEIVVAFAGPAVNVVIAGILLLILQLTGKLGDLNPEDFANIHASNFLVLLMMVNITLVVFNLLPAFPMDGGRVFRAALSFVIDRVKATQIAANAGKLVALFFIIYGLFNNPFLILIGVFVIFGAQTEYEYTRSRSLISGITTGDIMMHNFTPLHPLQTIGDAIKVLLNGRENKFVVIDNGVLTGVITKNDIIRGLQSSGDQALIQHYMTPHPVTVQADMPLQNAYDMMVQQRFSLLPVMKNGQLVGLLDMDNIAEALMILQAKKDFSSKA